jgi:hypothetical protein
MSKAREMSSVHTAQPNAIHEQEQRLTGAPKSEPDLHSCAAVQRRLAVVLASFACVVAVIQASAVQQAAATRELTVKGRVAQVHSAKLFTLHGDVAGESEVLVIPPRRVSTALVGSDVEVRGALRRMSSAELGGAWKDIAEEVRRTFAGRRVIVATSLIATAPAETPSASQEAGPPEPATLQSAQTYALPVGQPRLRLMPNTLVDFINEFAGQHIAISNVRVVGVYQPTAFLIEPATRYQMTMDYRDRILVLVDAAQLTVTPDAIVSGIVSIEGIARTLTDLRLKAAGRWPAKLTPEMVDRLEVRGGILASSVRTPEGTELTSRAVASVR